MPRTPEQIADKFEREWLESKAFAIQEYTAIASTIAQRAIDAKQTMIDNFTAVMAGSKFEDRLQPYVGSQLMGNAYTDSLNDKTTVTASEKLKVQTDVTLKRGLAGSMDAALTLYKNAATGDRTVPAGLTDQALKAMLIQGINAQQFLLSAGSTAQQIYDATDDYMGTFLGWPLAE